MKIFCISSHPDDEVLGCGGTIARYISEGDFVHVAFISTSYPVQDTIGRELKSRISSILHLKR